MHRTLSVFFIVVIALAAMTGPAVALQGSADPRPSAPNAANFERDGVHIVASVHAQVYSWTVTNIDAPPIMRFSIPEQNTYNQNFPPGWRLHVERGVFTAYTNDERLAIHPGQTRTFDARTGSAGSMLGPATLTLGFSADGADIVVENVWAPLPKRRSIVVMVAATLMLLGLLHVAMLRRLEKRTQT